MKKTTFGLLLIILALPWLSACSRPKSASPCDIVMPEAQFAQKYEGKVVTFMGVYSGGTIYAYRVGDENVCASTLEQSVAFYPIFVQDVVDENGQLGKEIFMIPNERINSLIGKTGFLGFGTDDDSVPYVGGDIIINLVIHNTEVVKLQGRPAECIDLDVNSVKELNGKQITVVGYENNPDRTWGGIFFRSEGQTYCLEQAYVEVFTSVVDLTGKSVLSHGYGHWMNRSHVMNLTGTVKLDDSYWVSVGSVKQAIFSIVVGNATERGYGDPMVFEIKSRPSGIDFLRWNKETWGWKFVNSVKPEAVNPGYLLAPRKYIDGGELAIGTVLGYIGESPLTVTSIECALGGFSFQPVQSIDYAVLGINRYTLTAPDSYLYLVDGSGDGQDITYFHVPALQPGCPTEHK